MSEHTATIVWVRGSQKFVDNQYSRAHKWKFDGGMDTADKPRYEDLVSFTGLSRSNGLSE